MSKKKFVALVSADEVNKTSHSKFTASYKHYQLRMYERVRVRVKERLKEIPKSNVCIRINQIQYEIFTAFRHLSQLWIITAHFGNIFHALDRLSVGTCNVVFFFGARFTMYAEINFHLYQTATAPKERTECVAYINIYIFFVLLHEKYGRQEWEREKKSLLRTLTNAQPLNSISFTG